MSSYWKLPPFRDGFWLADAATLLFVASIASRTYFYRWYSMIFALPPVYINNGIASRCCFSSLALQFVLLPIDRSTACLTACLYLLIGYTIEHNLARDAPHRKKLHRRRTMEGRDSDNEILHRTIVTVLLLDDDGTSFMLAFVLTYWRCACCCASCSWYSANWASPMAWKQLSSFV